MCRAALWNLNASSTGCLGLCIPSPLVPLGCWGGCGQSWGRVSDPTVPQPRLVSQPGSQPAQHGAVAKLELMNELLSLHYLQEGGNIWGERVHSFLLK